MTPTDTAPASFLSEELKNDEFKQRLMKRFSEQLTKLREYLGTALSQEQKRAINSGTSQLFDPSAELQQSTQLFIVLRTLEILNEDNRLTDFITYAQSFNTEIDKDKNLLSDTINKHGIDKRAQCKFTPSKIEQDFIEAFKKANDECCKILNPDYVAERHALSRRAMLGGLAGFALGSAPPLPKTAHNAWQSITKESLPSKATQAIGAVSGYSIGAYLDDKELDAQFAALMKAQGPNGVSLTFKELLNVTAYLGKKMQETKPQIR